MKCITPFISMQALLLASVFIMIEPQALAQPVDDFGNVASVESESTMDRLTDSLTFAAHLGTISVDSIDDNAMGYGITADYALDESVHVGGSLEYWGESENAASGRIIEYSDLALGLHGKYLFRELTTSLRPYVMGGVALHRLDKGFKDQLEGESLAETGSSSEVENEPGLDVGAGALYEAYDQIGFLGEIAFRSIIDDAVAYDQLALRAGLSYRFQ